MNQDTQTRAGEDGSVGKSACVTSMTTWNLESGIQACPQGKMGDKAGECLAAQRTASLAYEMLSQMRQERADSWRLSYDLQRYVLARVHPHLTLHTSNHTHTQHKIHKNTLMWVFKISVKQNYQENLFKHKTQVL